MDSKVSKVRQLKLLMEVTRLLIDSGVCPKSDRAFSEWFRMVVFCHNHGYLYVGFNGERIDLAVVAYRVPEITSETGNSIPETESGNILYVPMAASKTDDKLKLTRLLRLYVKDNPEVKEISYHYRNSNILKRFHLRSNHGQTIEA